jgi:hypothetical protein
LFNLETVSIDGAGNKVSQTLVPIHTVEEGRVEGSAGESLEEATVSLYIRSRDGQWRLWNADVYMQENPQDVGEEGSFSYFLPVGTYRMGVTVAGYRDFVSEPFVLKKPQPVGPVIKMEPRPGFEFLGERLSVPWFLDFWARKQEVEIGVTAVGIEPPDLGIGKEAPDFKLLDQEGEEVQLSSFRGSRVLLSFWSTWEPLSSEQIPLLSSLSDRDDLVILPIALQETRGRVKTYLSRGSYSLRSAVDENGDLGELYRLLSLPQQVLVGKDGRIVDVHVGVLTVKEILVLLE